MRYFVPFKSNSPSTVEIKGHRLMIVCTNRSELIENSDFLKSDEVREVYVLDNPNLELANLAASVHGGVIVAPPGMKLTRIINSLEDELPWVH